jgi:aminopeptidase YwaD
MMNRFSRGVYLFIFLMVCTTVKSQNSWYYQWGLLPDNIIDYFIGESSGERAYNHIIEMSKYNRQRNSSEFAGTLIESQYVVNKLNEYGLSEVNIERFGKSSSWRGVIGTLWETGPNPGKIADMSDMPFMLVSGSKNADVEAGLIYIGDASANQIDRLDLNGKIVLTSARSGAILNMMLQKGVEYPTILPGHMKIL